MNWWMMMMANGNVNNLDRPVPLFSLRETDKADVTKIHRKSVFCISVVIYSIVGYILGIVLFFVGLMGCLYGSNGTNYGGQSVSPAAAKATEDGGIAMLIIGAIVVLSTIILRIARLVEEFKIAKLNKTLLKYYTKLDNSIISRYMYYCQKNTFILWWILTNMWWGTIIDMWLVKESKRILNLQPLTQAEEQQLQDQWINEFVRTNSNDPRIMARYRDYMNGANTGNNFNTLPPNIQQYLDNKSNNDDKNAKN